MGDNGEESLIGRKCEFIDAATADRPAGDRISRLFRFDFRVGYGEVLFVVTNDRISRLNVCITLIVQLFVEDVQISAGIRGHETRPRIVQPFDTRHFTFIQIALRRGETFVERQGDANVFLPPR